MVGDFAGKVAGSFFLVELVVLAVDKSEKNYYLHSISINDGSNKTLSNFAPNVTGFPLELRA